MSNPAPLQAFLGGIGLAIPVHFLLTLNGSIFGISGFIHGAVRGGKEAFTSVVGFLLGGVIIGAIEGAGPETISVRLPQIALSGLLVGIGSKVRARPCFCLTNAYILPHSYPPVVLLGKYVTRLTSFSLISKPRHMICGISRFSPR